LLELDELFHNLLQYLGGRGYLDNTVVVLVGDHGELLGEHHMLDHQFAVYDQLLRVPLVVHYPPRFAAGREQRPVMNFDLFPTLLELAGVKPPVESKAVSLLRPLDRRVRMGEYPAPLRQVLNRLGSARADFDPKPWARSLRAYYDEPHKLIAGSDGRHELYKLDDDPAELHNLIEQQPELAQRLVRDLQTYVDSLLKVTKQGTTEEPPKPVDEEHLRRLEALGYAASPVQDEDEPNDSEDEP
jgi:arylsulfatase A-like enzyme